LNVLPDYLTDEIMFAREQGTTSLGLWCWWLANMFYWRLNQYLQKKVEWRGCGSWKLSSHWAVDDSTA
jgi:hypothetical protein